MSKTIEASLVLISSIAITALIMVVVFPVHALGDTIPASAADGVQPAVYVEGARSCPATGKATGECPFLAERTSGVSCPYLAAIAAASGCPAFSPQSSAPTPPSEDGNDLPDPRMKLARVDADPTARGS